MKKTTFITDMFGSLLNKNDQHDIPFILIHCYKPEIILTTIITGKYYICKPTMAFIENTLYTHQINPANFGIMGDIFISGNKLPHKITIIMANKNMNISKPPINYIIADEIDDYFVWKPVCHKKYIGLGFVISKEKPGTNEMVTLHSDLVTEYNGHIFSNNVTNMNEFNLLATYKTKKYTLARSALLDKNNNVEISSKIDGKFINENTKSGYNVDTNKIPISHTIQGELRIGKKCLSIDDDHNVHQNDCDDSTENKWYFYNDHIVSDYNQSCLTVNNNDITSKPCKISDKNQTWNIKNTDSVIVDNLQDVNDKWSTMKGKNVILFESDNPWYVNKTQQIEGLVEPQTTELNTVEYEPMAQYESSFKIDPTSPDLGHGHSFVERNGAQYYDSCFRDDEKIEGFGQEKKYRINFNSVICCLILFVFMMLAIKFFYN